MKKYKPIITCDAVELAKAFGMSAADGSRWELRSQLTSRIIEAVKSAGYTHAEVAAKAETSRTRMTQILNRNIDDVSTDLLLRILERMGYRITISVSRKKLVA